MYTYEYVHFLYSYYSTLENYCIAGYFRELTRDTVQNNFFPDFDLCEHMLLKGTPTMASSFHKQ